MSPPPFTLSVGRRPESKGQRLPDVLMATRISQSRSGHQANSDGSTPAPPTLTVHGWRGFVACIAVLLCACPGKGSLPLPNTAIHHRVVTADGWSLSLTEYRPAHPTGRPVLLVHGISANDRNLDLDATHSLARWLASHGRDTFNLSLRGTGTSDGPDPERGRAYGYTFDTMAREDLPAAIAFVRQATHAPLVDYVGHSMGGMLLYAYLAEGGQGVGAGVTLGSPTRLDFGSRLDPLVLGAVNAMVGKDSAFATATPARFLLPIQAGLDDGPVARLFYNPANVTPATWKELLAVGVDDISGALLIQLSALIRDGRFQSADGKLDYRRDMAKIHVPLLVVAGKADRLGTVMAVKDGYRALGGPKEWLLLGEENGFAHDYGLMDMVLGERASVELWPRVLDFLDRHSR